GELLAVRLALHLDALARRDAHLVQQVDRDSQAAALVGAVSPVGDRRVRGRAPNELDRVADAGRDNRGNVGGGGVVAVAVERAVGVRVAATWVVDPGLFRGADVHQGARVTVG